MFSKNPHLGDKRSKVAVDIHLNFLTFKTNDYFLRNSYYTLYFKGMKNKKIKSRNVIRTLDDLLDKPIPVDDALSCSATLFVDSYHEKYLDGKFKNKFRKIVVRQMTKLRSGEVLYRDVGYVALPLHIFVRSPETIDNRLVITHPVNKIDAFIDCTINVKLDSFQTKLPFDATRSLNKKLSRSLSSFGLTEAPKKKSLITINSQYFDIKHSRDDVDVKEGGLELRDLTSGKEDSDDEEDKEGRLTPSKIEMLGERSASLLFKTDAPVVAVAENNDTKLQIAHPDSEKTQHDDMHTTSHAEESKQDEVSAVEKRVRVELDPFSPRTDTSVTPERGSPVAMPAM